MVISLIIFMSLMFEQSSLVPKNHEENFGYIFDSFDLLGLEGKCNKIKNISLLLNSNLRYVLGKSIMTKDFLVGT